MTTTVGIFSRDGCQPCRLTRNLFRSAGVDTVYLPVEDFHDDYVAQFSGNKELPGVVVHDSEGNVLDSWTGFRPDLIRKHTG